MSDYFSGKRSVVTGAGDGIGRAMAIQLNHAGCELWLCDVAEDRLAATAALLNPALANVHTAVVDCGDKRAIEQWAAEVAASTDRIDALFNNAGVSYAANFEESQEDNFQWLMNINFWGVVWCTRAFMPLVKNASVGHIVNISSIFGMVGIAGQSAYNAAKFGVRGFTESLIAEYRNTSIAVSCVHPGGIATNIAKRSRADGEWDTVTAEERDQQFKQHTPTTPEQAAGIILAGAAQRKARIMVGKDAWLVQLLARLFPVGYHALTTRWLDNARNSQRRSSSDPSLNRCRDSSQ